MYMGGVDLHDQYRAKYDVGSCSKNYWRYLFWFLLNCCIVNAFIMYKLTFRRKIGSPTLISAWNLSGNWLRCSAKEKVQHQKAEGEMAWWSR
ncbi:hypothetical protein DPMN_136892 [Dreissena polymorpha]|uniref:PiggyBac transposable element-derived protein domain-containing protein n=1 Tax=Dreissena polymorpha TaxID=45954 RepID=A0A9D4JE81_DREPO|nr:hypothetical protein DPMN_136892 [Dreissena polymorpha]